MANLEIGNDIVENSRLTQKIIKRFLSKKEYEIYQNLEGKRALEYASGRWAAKESIIKASDKKIKFYEIEILSSTSGKPTIYINGELNTNIKISISHENKYTVATAIIIF